MSSRWTDPDFLAEAHAWIDRELGRLGVARAGEPEQPHVYPWATALRVPTERGDVWFKANSEQLRQEAALVAFLAARRPELVPPVLASDPERGWMLTADAGEPLRRLQAEERDLSRWMEILPAYAHLQLDLATDVDELLALGVPDVRLATLPERYEALVAQIDVEPRFRDAVPYVVELRDELASFGLPETIQHDDLHDGQVFVRDGGYLLLDWGDACVSHPFFTLSVTLEGMLAWGLDDVQNAVDTAPFRDAYLAPWRERYDVDLERAVEVALRLGWAARAVNSHAGGGDPERVPARLAMFLDGRV